MQSRPGGSLDACPSGLEQTLERSSLLGFKVFPILKTSRQPPLNPSAAKPSLSMLPNGSPSSHPCRARIPCHADAADGCFVHPELPAPVSPPSPSALWLQFLPLAADVQMGPQGTPHQQQQTRAANIRPDSPTAWAVTHRPDRCPFYGDLQENPSSWHEQAAGRDSGKGMSGVVTSRQFRAPLGV